MTITVIFTGGTIGSTTKDTWIGPDVSANYTLLAPFRNRDGVTFRTVAPYTVLSENLAASQLNALQAAIRDALAEAPDGIIVTHGTDTLQFSAAAAALAFADAAVPVVFVSADHPLDDPRSNGFCNFEAALAFIEQGGKGGVYAAYKNQNEDTVTVHSAWRLLRHGEGAAELYSLRGETVADCRDGAVTFREFARNAHPEAVGCVTYLDNAPLLSVDSLPGNRFAYPLDGVRAILLSPYHSATLNTDSEALAALCREADRRDIPVFVCGVPQGPAYESSSRFEELHIRTAPYSTFAVLYMKLWAACSLDRDPVAFVNTRFGDESPT